MKAIIFLLAIGLLASCTAPMDVDVRGEEARLVVYSILLDQNINQKVSIQSTVPYFSTGTKDPIDDARVTVSTSEGDIYLTQWDAREQAYLTIEPFSTAPGVTYDLDVEYDFDEDGTSEHYTATTTILPQPLELEAMSITRFEIPMAAMPIYQLAITGKDPPGRNFYVMRIAKNGVLYNRLDNFITVGDRMFQDGRFEDFPLRVFPGEADEEDPDRMWLMPGDEITLYLSNVDEDFMRFIAEVQSSDDGGNPLFGGPPHNVRTNISGGAVGFFGSLYSSPVHVGAVVPE